MSAKNNGVVHRIVWWCAFLYLAVEALATIGATFPGNYRIGEWLYTLGQYAEVPGWIMIAVITIRQELRHWISKELNHKDAEKLCIIWFEFIVLLVVFGHLSSTTIVWPHSSIDTSVFIISAYMASRVSRWASTLKAVFHATRRGHGR